ncbi:MAG: fasciclin domain-containing protein [Bacteroidota bacterium]
MPFLRFPYALVLALAVLFSACDSDNSDDPPQADPDIVEVAQSSADLTTLVTALTEAGLVGTLKTDGPFTVFAPTNSAFGDLPDGELDRLLEPENEDELEALLLYHVLDIEAMSSALSDGLELTTLNGATFTVVASAASSVGFGIDTDGDGMADANIQTVDIGAGNGIVHLIDAVLLPPSPDTTPDIVELAQGNADLTTLVTALGAADLVGTLKEDGPFTVFAPTNSAFANLPDGELDRLLEPENKETLRSVLFYHVLGIEARASALSDGLALETANMLMWTVVATSESPSGFGIDTDGDGDADANIVQTDISASNGVVHVIDQVLLPSSAQTITAVAAKNANFKELVGALGSVSLDETLAEPGPFTVFAPVNSAFEDLDAVPSGEALRGVLLYHVLNIEAFSSALENGLTLTTENGATFTVVTSMEAASGFGIDTNSDGMADANIQAVDVDAANGVIHVIDAVLLPPTN